MLIHVVGPDGRPMPGAKVYAGIHTKEQPFKGKRDYVCDARGQAVVELPQTFDDLRIWAGSDGYVPMFASWIQKFQVDGHLVPEEFTFQLPQGTLIGGFIKNEDGQPITGARVEVSRVWEGGIEEVKPRPHISNRLATGSNYHIYPSARITDAQGRWSLDNVPAAGDEIEVRVSLSHPDYVDDLSWGGLQREQNVTTESLRTGTATIVMPRGISVTGTVTDANGKPVAGAVVIWGRGNPLSSFGSKNIRTDERGVYRFSPLPPGPIAVTVMAEGWAPELKEIEIGPQNPPVDFQLKPGRTIRLRIVDGSGAPVPQVEVEFSRWRDSRSLYNVKHPYVLDNKIPRYTDEEGLYEWTWAPEDPVTYSFYKKGYQYNQGKSLTADDLEHEIRLAR